MRFLTKTLFVMLVIALFCVQAQDITKGSIAGVVKDASGAVIPGVTVKLSSPNGDHTATTNSTGEYLFPNLPVGSGYVLTVDQPGFSSAKMGNLTVGINSRTTADINLQVGQSTQTVEVNASGGTAIDMVSTGVGANLNEELYKNVPVGRSAERLPRDQDPRSGDRDGDSAPSCRHADDRPRLHRIARQSDRRGSGHPRGRTSSALRRLSRCSTFLTDLAAGRGGGSARGTWSAPAFASAAGPARRCRMMRAWNGTPTGSSSQAATHHGIAAEGSASGAPARCLR